MVADDQPLLALQPLQDSLRIGAAEKHIPKNIYRIVSGHSIVPVLNHRLVHFLGGGKGTVAEPDDIVVTEMRVCRKINHRVSSAALDALETFSEHWDKKYPKIAQSWRDNWPNLSTYFKYPQEVRRLIYTTNAIEGFNRQLRKVTKAKSVLPTDDSLLKMLYLAMMDITKKWTGRRQDWSVIHTQLAVFFADRMPD